MLKEENSNRMAYTDTNLVQKHCNSASVLFQIFSSVKQFRTKSVISYSNVLLSQAPALGKQQYHDTYADISN